MSEGSHKSCLVELHYLPCIRYLQLCFTYATVHIEACENYQKGSYRNRAYILSPQGKQMLSVPLLKGKHQQSPVTEVQVAYHTPWYAQHWHAIETAYGSAPYFIHYADDVRKILYRKHMRLYDLNYALLAWALKSVHAPCSMVATDDYAKKTDPGIDDFRNQIMPSKKYNLMPYPQVFEDRLGFISNLSVLDVLMHLGPEAYIYLQNTIRSTAENQANRT